MPRSISWLVARAFRGHRVLPTRDPRGVRRSFSATTSTCVRYQLHHYHQSDSNKVKIMTSPNTPIPLVVFGATSAIGALVIEALKPDYEVIHFFNEVAQGKEDLPRLLAAQTPKQPSGFGLGTQNYARPPQGVVLGKGFANEDVDEIRAATLQGGKTAGVPWVTGGLPASEVAKVASGEITMPSPEKYAPVVAQKVRETFKRIDAEGKWGVDKVWLWES